MTMNHNHTPVPGTPGFPAFPAHQGTGPMAPYQPQPSAYGRAFDPTVAEETSFNLLSLFNYAIRYRWLIALLFFIGFAVGVAMTWMQVPQYRTSTNLELLPKTAKIFQDLEITSNDSDRRAIQTAIARVKSRQLAQLVVFDLNLANNRNFVFPKPGFSFSNIFSRLLGTETQTELSDVSAQRREQIAISIVQNGTSASNLRGTSIVRITFKNPDPVIAQKVTNQLAKSFIAQRIDQNSETSVSARAFLNDQVKQSKERLQKSEEALVAYAKDQKLTVTGDNETSLISASIAAINTALSEAVREKLNLARSVEVIDAGRGRSLPVIVDSEGIGRLSERVAQLRSEYQRKSVTLKPGFPEMRQLQNQINAVQGQLQAAIATTLQSEKLKYEAAVNKEKDLRANLKELEARQAEFQDKRVQYGILKREVESNRKQYDTLTAKLNDVGVASELKNAEAVVIDPALRPTIPFEPSMRRNVMLSVLVFLLAAAGIIYLRELMNNTFTNPDQVEQDLGLPLLGIIPRFDEQEIREQLNLPTSPMSEAYRSLRTSLQFTGTGGTPRTLLVTSGQPAEGKSTTSFQIARNMAALGTKVLLIDADMRKPSAHRQAGIANVIGLSNVLANAVGNEDPNRIFNATDTPNLYLMTAGTIPPNPVDLLSSPNMAMLLSAATQRFDVVIIDAPPVVGLADAIIMHGLVEGTVFCVSCNQITRKASNTAVRRLRASGGNIVGAVFTKFKSRTAGYGDGYSYMNYNYYTYGGEETQIEDQRQSGTQKPWPAEQGDGASHGGRGDIGGMDEERDPIAAKDAQGGNGKGKLAALLTKRRQDKQQSNARTDGSTFSRVQRLFGSFADRVAGTGEDTRA
ncbi:MAG: polysaccharide biosynthesis tyrosine autokinase [Pseudomonadota bacterium]